MSYRAPDPTLQSSVQQAVGFEMNPSSAATFLFSQLLGSIIGPGPEEAYQQWYNTIDAPLEARGQARPIAAQRAIARAAANVQSIDAITARVQRHLLRLRRRR